tara:strand:+ start:664 stop:879 length:216 start_codon:yes stop_codon:yes gene_type:complete
MKTEYTINIKKFNEACDKLKDEYIDTAHEAQMNPQDMQIYFDQANIVEIARRAILDYIKNGEKFSNSAFEE